MKLTYARGSLWLIVLLAPLVMGASECSSPEQTEIIRLVNEDRATRGLAALKENPGLNVAADEWAEQLATAGALSSSDLTAWCPKTARRCAENVGSGASIAAVQTALMAKTATRASVLLSPCADIGAGQHKRGTVHYVVQRFVCN
jgi:hypothetical protein